MPWPVECMLDNVLVMGRNGSSVKAFNFPPYRTVSAVASHRRSFVTPAQWLKQVSSWPFAYSRTSNPNQNVAFKKPRRQWGRPRGVLEGDSRCSQIFWWEHPLFVSLQVKLHFFFQGSKSFCVFLQFLCQVSHVDVEDAYRTVAKKTLPYSMSTVCWILHNSHVDCKLFIV